MCTELVSLPTASEMNARVILSIIVSGLLLGVDDYGDDMVLGGPMLSLCNVVCSRGRKHLPTPWTPRHPSERGGKRERRQLGKSSL